jgi:hypothetical protein
MLRPHAADMHEEARLYKNVIQPSEKGLHMETRLFKTDVRLSPEGGKEAMLVQRTMRRPADHVRS